MIAQLQGREKGARALRVEGRRAEWIVFACLHSGVFIRDQRSRFLDAHPEQVRCGVHALIARGMATDEMARIEEAILHAVEAPSEWIGRKIARGGAYIPTLPPARSKRQVCNFRWPTSVQFWKAANSVSTSYIESSFLAVSTTEQQRISREVQPSPRAGQGSTNGSSSCS